MTLLASALPSPTLNFKAKVFVSGPPSHVHGPVLLHSRLQRPPSCSMESSSAQYGESNKFRKQLIVISESVRRAVPKSLREFPWREAESLLLDRLISLGKTVFKWSIVVWFAISFLSDGINSIAMNQELMVPLGLFIGCLACDFLKESANEMLPDPEVQSPSSDKGLINWQFVGISCFFILVKLLSVFSGLRTRVFLLHFGNGGVLQLLWLFHETLWMHNSTVQPDHSSEHNA